MLAPGAAATPESILAVARLELAAFKCPRHLEILPDLPRTGSGKVVKQALRRLLEQRGTYSVE